MRQKSVPVKAPAAQVVKNLNAKNGKEFDRTYDQVQVKAHRDAVALFEAYGKSGDGPRSRQK